MRSHRFWISALAVLALAACGDDDGGPITGTDSGVRRDTGPGGGFDSGPGGGTDSGPGGGTDSGPGGGTDSGTSGGGDGSTPTTPGGIGSACMDDMDCAGDSTCFTMVGMGGFGYEFPGGYCSKMCTAGSGSTECGAGGDCFTLGFGGFGTSFCAKTCTSDADCRMDEGYTCQMPPLSGGGTMRYCTPDMGGGGWMRDGGGFGFDGSFPGF